MTNEIKSYMYIRELITKLMNNGLEKKAAIIKQRFKEVTGVDIVDYKLLNLKEGDLICAIQGKTEGFYNKDLFILLAKNRIIGHNHSNQQHARKFHSYFIVLKKQKRAGEILKTFHSQCLIEAIQ